MATVMRTPQRQMKTAVPITTLFLDVGGVLLTNGWGHQSRALAAREFDLNVDELEDRHHLTFDTYEVGIHETR
jgi:putative hydrolase of the HAD superfamily